LFIFAPQIVQAQGYLLLVGGGSEYSSWADAPYGWFVEKANFGKIINIDVDPASQGYRDYFIALGADTSGEAFRIATKSAANDSATYKKLITARGIFIEGGHQSQYIQTWKGTLVEDAIHFVFQHGGAIGGTSAGLAVLGQVVYDATGGYLYPDEAAYNAYTPDIHLTDDFLNILPNVLTDSHFFPRGRLTRLIPMLARRIIENNQQDLMGIGLCDNTALCVDESMIGTVFGDATVSILYKSKNSIIDCQQGKPLTFTDIVFHHLPRGAVFDLANRQLIDPGLYLNPVTSYKVDNNFSNITLSGIDDKSPNAGSIVIKNITSRRTNAWKGYLSQSAGSNTVPNSVIIHKLMWENPANETYYFENRWIGGMWGIADFPGYRAIYLNGDKDNSEFNSEVDISQDGILTVTNGVAYILKTNNITHHSTYYTRTANRATNYRGFVNAQLFFLKQGDTVDLKISSANVGFESHQKSQHIYLYPNYPNPFNSVTSLSFFLKNPENIQLSIFNVHSALVRTIASGWFTAGRHSYEWDGKNQFEEDVASGVYFYHLTSASKVFSQKMLLLK